MLLRASHAERTGSFISYDMDAARSGNEENGVSGSKTTYIYIYISVIFCASTTALAAGSTDFWVSSDGTLCEDAIRWYKTSKEYVLFLPSARPADQLCIGFAGAEKIAVDGQTVQKGDSAAILVPGKTHTVKIGKGKYQLNVMQGSAGLPTLYIHTESGRLDKIHKNKANREAGTLLFLGADGETQYAGDLSHIKMRGNSSTTFKKKNYQIKLAEGANLMDMGKSRTWILTGNSRDKSLLRNQISLDLAEYGGMPYTPEHMSAEVYINHEYMGCYLFGEKVMIDDDRIDIFDLEAEMEEMNEADLSTYPLVGSKAAARETFKAYDIPNIPEDITGGYLIEFESYKSRYREEASAYHTKKRNTLVIKSPEYCSEEQMKYISSFMQSFEDAIFASDGRDAKTGKHYSELVDMDSLVSKYMLEEIVKNYDGNNSSMFFFKPVDAESTVAFAGPAWDYDSAYGSYAQEHSKKNLLSGQGFWISSASSKRFWWPALYRQADFKAAVMEKWQDSYAKALRVLLGQEKDERGILMSLDEYAASIADSAAMNFTRWPNKKNPSSVANTGHTFEMNIDYLRTFLEERYAFLEEEWGR